MNQEEALPDNLRKAIDINNPQPNVPRNQNKLKTWHFRATNVHDFAWTADPTYRMSEVTWNGIKCVALAQEHNSKNWTKTAQYLSEVIAFYSRNFGMYEYPKIVVADAADGMEYPMLTLCGGSYPSHRALIAHEVAHNWFMGMVGSNETYRAALDEGFTQFLTAEALSEFKIEPFPEYSRAIGPYLEEAIDGEDERLNTHSNEFHEAVGHGGGYGNVYYKTATMLYNLRYFLGDSVFQVAMKNYVQQWKFRHPYVEDFRNSVIQSAQIDLNKFFDQWFESKEVIDYGIKSVKYLKKEEQFKITVRRYGNLTMPVNLDLVSETESGRYIVKQITIPTNQYIIPNRLSTKVWNSWGRLNREFTIYVNHEPKHTLKEIYLDGQSILADIDRRNNRWKKKVDFKFDQGQGPTTYILNPYEVLFRPAWAYNQFSGSLAGVKLTGQYANRKHVFDARIYYALHNQVYALNYIKIKQQNVLGFVKWRHDLRGGGTYFADITTANQRVSSTVGWKWKLGNHLFGLYGKHLQTLLKNSETILNQNSLFNGFLPTTISWSDRTNTNFHLFWNIQYSGWSKSGTIALDTRLISPWSQTQFGWINLEWKHQQPIKSTTLKSRIFAQMGHGNNPSPESALYASSANLESQFQNMIMRNLGEIQPNISHFGGGLNLRGFHGRVIGVKSNDSVMAFFRGSSGISINTEWHFGNLLSPFLKNKFVSLTPYLFADAGLIAFQKSSQWYNSGLLADAGIGTWINFNNYNKIISRKNTYNPKTVRYRFDIPLFLNTIKVCRFQVANWR
jgi:aminopeptidase N